jgi:hypothetical protein
MFIYTHILSYCSLVIYVNLCIGVMMDNLSCSHERLSIITPISQINVKDQRTVRKDMGVNEHERLSIITPIHKLT